MSDPLPIISRFWDNYVGPRLIMWAPRLTMSGPRDYYVGAPTMSGPLLVMSGPWDDHMGTLTYYVGAEIIMFRPRFFMLGPLIIMSGPQLLCDKSSIYYIFFNHNHIWQVSLQLSCDDTFQMWTYAMAQMCHDKAENLGNNGTKAIGLITPSQV